MPKRLKCDTAILCEHVVAGANRKHTLINVYGGNVLVEKFPAMLTFGIYLQMAPGLPSQLKLEIKIGDENVGTMNANVQTQDPHQPTTLIIPLITVEIAADTVFSVVASAEGYSRTTLMSKRIFQGVIPRQTTASEPPS